MKKRVLQYRYEPSSCTRPPPHQPVLLHRIIGCVRVATMLIASAAFRGKVIINAVRNPKPKSESESESEESEAKIETKQIMRFEFWVITYQRISIGLITGSSVLCRQSFSHKNCSPCPLSRPHSVCFLKSQISIDRYRVS